MGPTRCESCGAAIDGPHACADAPRGGDTLTAPAVAAPVPAQAASEPSKGELLAGRYQLVERVGEGGGGMVFRARDRELGVQVALKILRRGPSYEQLLRRLKREIRITRDVDHANVSRVFDLSESEGVTFFTMRWIDGEPLHRRVQKGPLAGEALRRLATGLVAALAAAHRIGVVHRDVKPANVLVSEAGDPVLVDFGIATDEGVSPNAAVRRGEPITLSGKIPGTPAFMAPEQVDGKASLPATDLWSLALTIAFAIEGRIHRPDNPRKTFAPLGSPLAGLLARSLETDPERRPRDAVEIEAALGRARARRRLIWTSAVWSLLLLAVAAGGALATRRAEQRAAHAGPPLVWVGDVENASGDRDLDWLARGVADLVRSGLEGSGGARLAPTVRGAGARVEGRVTSGAQVELTLAVGGRTERVRFGATGEDLFRGVDSATERLRARLGTGAPRSSRSRPAPPSLTRNHEALRRYERGLAHVRAHRNREALDELRRAVEVDPAFGAAHLVRYMLAIGGHGTVAEADTALARAAAHPERLTPTGRELLLALQDARARGVEPAPLSRLRAHLRASPPDSTTYFLASTIGNVDRQDRRGLLEEWAARLPLDPEPHNRLGYVLMRDFGDPVGAEREFLAYLKLAPDDANAHDSYADYLAGQRRWAESAREYTRALEIDPTFVNAALDSADVLLHEGDLAGARARLEKARPLVVDFREVHMWVERAGAISLLGGDAPGALRFLADVARDPAFGTRAYLARQYEAVVRAVGGDAAGARRAAEDAVRLGRRFHGDETILASLPAYVDALSAYRRRDRPGLERAAAALGALGPTLDTALPDRRRLATALQSVVTEEPAVAAERLVEAIQSNGTGVAFVAACERARALVRAGRLPEASHAFDDANERAMEDLRTPEVASGLRACLAESAVVARSLGQADRADAIDARLAALARSLGR